MKIFKTERVSYFNAKFLPIKFKKESDKILSKPEKSSMKKFICHKKNLYPQHFLNNKVFHFNVDKYDSLGVKQEKIQKEGRWTLKEHIQFLQALDKFGISWKKISDLIPSRTPTQIRSHSQKFYKRLKECKDTELGIDFTSKHINNVNDMIAHIREVNKDYNIVTIFLYLSEKCFPDKNPKKPHKIDNININNILREDININIDNNIDDSDFNNNIKANIANKEEVTSNKIINNTINNSPINNIFINNINYFNGINNLVPSIQFYSYNSNASNSLNNNIPLQNIPFNTMDILSNYINSKYLLDKNYTFDYPINNTEIFDANNAKNHFE